MTANNITTIGQKLRDTYLGIESVRYGYAPDEIPQSLPGSPCFVIFLGPVDYPENAVSHRMTITFKVQLFVARLDQPTKLAELLKYIEPAGDDSFDLALRGNYRLTDTCDWAHTVGNTGQNTLEYNGISYLGTEFEISCISRFPYLNPPE